MSLHTFYILQRGKVQTPTPPPTTVTQFGDITFVSSDSLNDSEVANLVGSPLDTLRINCVLYTNNNGGTLFINDSYADENTFFDVVLDGNGNGNFRAEISGIPVTGTTILGKFKIMSSSNNTEIGTNNTYQISKAF